MYSTMPHPTAKHRVWTRALWICLLLAGLAVTASAAVVIQCPGDNTTNAAPWAVNATTLQPVYPLTPEAGDTPDPLRQVRCMHLAAGDGFSKMADGRNVYIFGFNNVTGQNASSQTFFADARLKAQWPAPDIVMDEGDQFYLTLTNVGFTQRPDLFDAHSVHFHGFPNSSAIFDGLPDSAFGINMFASLTYYYNVVDPGTYLYHCHVEATEHMHMGMLGNLWVRPAQNRYPAGYSLPNLPAKISSKVHVNPDYSTNTNNDDPLNGYKYAYNDGDGSTYYDVEVPLMMGGFDWKFHEADETVQPLPFASLEENYFMLNGRGYPDTLNPANLTNVNSYEAQKHPSIITVSKGTIILLRINNLNVTQFWSLTALGLPMKVIGRDARLLRSAGGQNLYVMTNSITLGGGATTDVLIDTGDPAVLTGTYPLYAAQLNMLANPSEDMGGLMTEIVIN